MARLLVFDTETGGLDPMKHSILSLGAVVWEDGRRGEGFEVLIREPEIIATEKALKRNRINLDEHCKKAKVPAVAMGLFRKFLEENFKEQLKSEGQITLVGHNVSLDVGFLRRLCGFADVSFGELFSHRFMDTASVLRFLMLAGKLPLSEPSSDVAFEYFEIKVPPELRHTALGDAVGTADLVTKLLEVVK